MGMIAVTDIVQTLEETNGWFKELKREIGTGDDAFAYRALGAVLHELRASLPDDEARRLGDELPMLIRGMYYGRCQAHIDGVDSLATRVAWRAGERDDPDRWRVIVAATMRVIARHVQPERVDALYRRMPPPAPTPCDAPPRRVC